MRGHLKVRLYLGVWSCVALLSFSQLFRSRAKSAAARRSTSRSIGARQPPPPSAYAGDASCTACHKEQAANYPATAHHVTSELPSAGSVGGNFNPGSNVLHTAVPELTYEMTLTNHQYLETYAIADEI